MKKISIVLAILLIAIGGVWFYLANKFEKIATEEMLPKLQQDGTLVSIDMDAVIIEKFKFQVILPNITIFPKSELFKIKSDKIIACYNPISDKIKMHFAGDKVTYASGELESYSPSPNLEINFNRSLLRKDFTNFDINISSKDESLYFSQDDTFISRADRSIINISSTLENDMYDMNLSYSVDAMQLNSESEFFDKLIIALAPEFATNSNLQKLNSFYYKIIEESGPFDYSTSYKVKLGENYVDNIIAAVKENNESTEVFKNAITNFSFIQDTYSIDLKENIKSKMMNDNTVMNFSGDGKTMKTMADISIDHTYSEKQKKHISGLFYEAFQLFSKKATSGIQDKLTETDFTELTKTFTDIQNIKLKVNTEYDVESSNFDHNIELAFNDVGIVFQGESKDKNYNGKIELSDPKIMIDTAAQTYASAIRPLTLKLNDDVVNHEIIAFDAIVKNAEENGFKALSAFHNEEELNEGGKLVSELSFDLGSFSFKINDKGFLEMLTDERVVKFLKDMPEPQEDK